MDQTLLITSFILLLLSNNYNLAMSVITDVCSTSKCGNSSLSPNIRFPFKVKDDDSNQPSSCGYRGFDVLCDRKGSNQTLIELPNSGKFTVKSIDYTAQEIWVNDPNNCLPKRLLSFNLSNSPFSMAHFQEFSFLNCSSTLVTKNNTLPLVIGPINCLSGLDYFVYAIPMNISNITLFSSPKCHLIASIVKVPVQRPGLLNNETGLSFVSKLDEDIRLSWFMPECRTCELHGQMCAVRTNISGLDEIICSNISNQDRSRKLPLTTLIAVIVVICSPPLICIVGSIYIWIRAYYIRQRLAQTSPDFEPEVSSIIRPGHDPETGLQEVSIELAGPVESLGRRNETGPNIIMHLIEEMSPRMLGEGDNVCSICMIEYHANDKTGTLPLCGHYFHIDCINEWLFSHRGILQRTCPICRARVGIEL